MSGKQNQQQIKTDRDRNFKLLHKYSIFCVKIEPVDRPGSASSSHLNIIILELVITIIIIIMENYCRAILLLRVVTICVTATHACNMIIVGAKEAGDHSN